MAGRYNREDSLANIKAALSRISDRIKTTITGANVSLPDLYAGKLCAALDRQHPRDLFDVKLLLENEGLPEELRKTFLIFLISHHRPIHELLAPNRRNIRQTYQNEFAAMAQVEVRVEELEAIRERLIKLINDALTPQEKEFLLSFKNRQPQWDLLGMTNVAEVAQLPSVRWKMLNLEKLGEAKYQELYEKLKIVLGRHSRDI